MKTITFNIQPPSGAAFERECGEDPVTFGRGGGADVVVTDGSMSRNHARIVAEAGGWVIEDLGARNGTYVNGERLTERQPIAPGDIIKMGATIVQVNDPAQEPDYAIGGGDLASSIFRPATEIAEATLPAAPSRVAARLKALNDFHRSLAGPITLDELLERLLDGLFSALHPEQGVVLLQQPDGTLATAASRRLPGAKGELLVSRRLAFEVVEKGTAALVSDLSIDERFSGAHSMMLSGVRSILAAPISDPAGCLGMVAIYSRAHVRRFGEEDLELLVSLASVAALRIRNVELAEEAAARRVQDRELALAHDIQMAMLPRRMPARPEVEMWATLIPARAVGGDLYDFLIIDDALWFVIADAAGKGVSAALFMAVTRTLFRAVARGEATVSSVLARMNAELAVDNERQFFVTALVGRLDLTSGRLAYSSAGHPAPLRLSTSGTAEPLAAPDGGIALGILEDAAYEEVELQLGPGELLLLFTDGVTEAINVNGELFSDARLLGALAEHGARPAADIVNRVVEAVNGFAAGAPQEDDITVLALRYLGAR
ncbi:MAG: SpoIIE family protein phosphatase [Acidobacteria bacterium]|nr:SpoIIE family protein phosphatase [Acidobacteriota bacterium]